MAHRIDFESLFSLEGRIALISGASSGLGEHFAQVLSEQVHMLSLPRDVQTS